LPAGKNSYVVHVRAKHYYNGRFTRRSKYLVAFNTDLR
jgi:hypothetical protein